MDAKYKAGDSVQLKNRRGACWNVFGDMDKYIGEIITLTHDVFDFFAVVDKDRNINWIFSINDIDFKVPINED